MLEAWPCPSAACERCPRCPTCAGRMTDIALSISPRPESIASRLNTNDKWLWSSTVGTFRRKGKRDERTAQKERLTRLESKAHPRLGSKWPESCPAQLWELAP